MTGDHDITGRDGYLIIDALAMAITVLEQLQSKDRPTTDIDDMRKLLRARCGDRNAEFFLQEARRKLKVLLRRDHLRR